MCEKETSVKDQISFFLNKSMLPSPVFSDKMTAEDFINGFVGTPNQQCSVLYASALQKEYDLPLDGNIEDILNNVVDTVQMYREKGLDDILLQLEISHYMKKNAALLKKVMSMKKI
jgi:hypothetical protein